MLKTLRKYPLALLPPGILTVAHLVAMSALLGFGWRADAYPFHPQALWLYWAAVPAATGVYVWLVRRTSRDGPVGTTDVLLASAPALASLALVGTLWLSPWLGGAPYAPYDMQDIDAVGYFSYVPAIFITTVAVAYGSPGFLLTAGGAQLLVYFGTHALPNWSIWPGADVLGTNPSIIMPVFYLYAGGLLTALLRRRLGPRARPGLWFASAAGGLVGGLLLFNILSVLPNNGVYLAYQASVPGIEERYLVPQNAWDASRPAALLLAVVAMVSGLATPLDKLSKLAGTSRHRYSGY